MKIHILTSVFYPEVHPRAFRATELAKEFARCGHEVMVTTLTANEGVDYAELEKKWGIKIQNLELYYSKRNSNIQQSFQSHDLLLQRIHRGYRFMLEYLLGGHLFRYAWRISQNIVIEPDTDLFLASSTPFMTILAGALYRNQHALTQTTFVADSGDPFSGSSQTKRALYMRWIEQWTMRYYNYLSIPTPAAAPAYQHVIEKEKIQIIPQGFQFNDTPLGKYKQHTTPHFAYAGVFYKDIRNPQFLLDWLVTYPGEFVFKIYLRHNNPEIAVLLEEYQKSLGNKLQVEYGKDRASLIHELSEYDFLVHVGNTVTTQLPSKLIDYGITGRPIYSCNQTTFDAKVLEQFLQGQYDQAMTIDIEPYRIEHVCQQFIELSTQSLC